MSNANGAYRAPTWLPGGHAQTIYASLLPRPEVRFRRERVETPDGDFVDFDWLQTSEQASPLVVLFHGLEGGSVSHYARALMRQLESMGWRGVVPHFRGCSGEPNRLPRAYHSGDYQEVEWMLMEIRSRAPNATIFAAGVSLGGSALLNWIGRETTKAQTMLKAAAAVSTPLDLSAAGFAIGQGLNRIYARHFLGTLLPKALAMARRFPGLIDEASVRRVGSMYAFDEAVTAPLHGFAGAEDYWSRASSKPWLKNIELPTLVINAKNDPFIPASSLPRPQEVGPGVMLEQPEHGGHGGFPAAPFPGHVGWLPARLVSFFSEAGTARPA